MKKNYLLLCFLLINVVAIAQNLPFITTWDVSSNDLEITIPTDPNSTYNYTVDFGDGTVLNNQTGDVTHTYTTAGTYTVSISGTFPRIVMSTLVGGFYNFTNIAKIQSIDQWGSIQWTSMEDAFRQCSNLEMLATDTPDLSLVTNMSYMFASSKMSNTNASINNWDVSNVTDMSHVFDSALYFNQSIDNWDVSNVTDMSVMFGFNPVFNQPLNSWDVSNVTNMWSMFSTCSAFNQPLSNWDVSNVVDMGFMFRNCNDFDQDLSSWSFKPGVELGAFLNNAGMSTYKYDLLLDSLALQNLQNLYIGVHNLTYCNSTARDYLINNLGWSFGYDALSSTCNFIVGNMLYDTNNDGCDPSDILVSGLEVMVTDGSSSFSTFSSNGLYELATDNITYTVSLGTLPSYFSATPVSTNVSFTNSTTETVDFCLTSTQNIDDLNVTLLPTSKARPGFDAGYQLIIQNVGTQTIANPAVSLDFDNTMQTFVSASPNPSSTTTNQLNFDFASIQPFEVKVVEIVMNTFQPPTVNENDILSFIASVTPNTNDYTPIDNTFNYNQTIVNSFDPNDKQVLQGEEIYEDEADEYLDYLIRFQNTGTASAINVRILDTLHPNLDYSTLQPINASHDYRVEITDGNQVEFIFDDIYLPDEISDEAGSHGFVAYKIKPKQDVVVGDFITGDAQIYFDFNAPIITNMVSTEVVDNQLNTKDFNLSTLLQVYPNPTTGIINLHSDESLKLQEVVIYNLQGKKLLEFNKNFTRLNVQNLSTGIYLMSIKTNQGELNKRLIKK